MNSQQTFSEFLSSCGLIAPSMIVDDGHIHRISRQHGKPGNKDGWYSYDGDGGVCGNWHTGEKYTWRTGKNRQRESIADREKREEKRRLRQQAKQRQHNAAALKAERLWNKALAGYSEYWKRKGVFPIGLRFFDTTALVPVRDAHGQFMSLQFIRSDGQKQFLRGGRKSGGFHIIGKLKKNSRAIICEGVATGLSIYEATKLPVIVAFDAGNLGSVVGSLKKAYPTLSLIIAADNDCWGSQNIGIQKAKSDSQHYQLTVPIIPVFPESIHQHQPTDFNDLHVMCGIEAVRQQIMGAIS